MTPEQLKSIKDRISDNNDLCSALDSLYEASNRNQETINSFFTRAKEAEERSNRLELELQRIDQVEYPG